MDYSPFIQDEPFILTIAGSKEGTGKSLIATNMAIQFAQAGLRIILIDHDLAAANMQSLYGINKADKTAYNANPRNKLENFLLEEGVPNLLMIPGNNFGLDFTTMNSSHKAKFFNQIKEISSADVVIIDLGGGATEQALDIFLMGHAGIIVTNTEPAGIINAYEFLKNAVYRTVSRMFRGQGELQEIVRKFLDTTNSKNSPSVEDLAVSIEQKNPWAAQHLREVCKGLEFYIIMNQAHSLNDVQLASKLHDICIKYLNLDPNFPGVLFYNNEIPAHTHIMAPMSITHPESVTCQTINRMGNVILDNMTHNLLEGKKKWSFKQQLKLAQEQAAADFPKNRIPANRQSAKG